MKKCLWVVPKGIFPVRDGARVANCAMIQSIESHFSQLDIMLFNEDESDEEYLETYLKDLNAKNVYFMRRFSFKNKFLKLFLLLKFFIFNPSLPVTTGYFHSWSLKKRIRSILSKTQYEVIVFDGLHPYTAFCDLEDLKKSKIVYRAHNVEGDLWSTAAEKTSHSIFKKLLLWQGEKMTKLEMSLIARANKTWCISEEDLVRFQGIQSESREKLTVIPVGIHFKKRERKNIEDNDPIKLLFLGKMDWAPNRDGLKWFLEEIWPQVNNSKFRLEIVGSGDASWGKELFESPGVNFIGFAKDLDAVYSSCDFSIIPIRYGSGTRIKVIESISKGVPVISTAMGVQGSGLVDYFKAETKEEWIELFTTLDRSMGERVAEEAFLKLEKMYSPRSIGQKAFETLYP